MPVVRALERQLPTVLGALGLFLLLAMLYTQRLPYNPSVGSSSGEGHGQRTASEPHDYAVVRGLVQDLADCKADLRLATRPLPSQAPPLATAPVKDFEGAAPTAAAGASTERTAAERAETDAERADRGRESAGFKANCEMLFWNKTFRKEGRDQFASKRLAEYRSWMTTKVGLSVDHYKGKKVLDIGPGPRGSLEWATEAALTVGIDPLADSYMPLGIRAHRMAYVRAPASQLPFPGGYFDVVVSLNSLNHVLELDRVISEMTRVLVPGGDLILIVDTNQAPNKCEPVAIPWDVASRFGRTHVVFERRFEKFLGPKTPAVPNNSIPFDFANPTPRTGFLNVRLRKDPA